MRTEEDLRAAYTDLAGRAPDPGMMLAAHQRRTQPRRRRRLAALQAGGALLAAATASATALAVLPGAAAPGTGGLSSARAILLTAAVSAARQPATGGYWHTSVRTNYLRPGQAGPNGTVMASELVHTWVSSSPSHRSWAIQRWLKGNWLTASGYQSTRVKAKNSSHVPIIFGGQARSFTVFSMTVGELEHLPASPSRLAAALRQAARRWIVTPASTGTVNSILFRSAFDLLRAPISPQVRAAVFRVLAEIPGVVSVGRIRDSQGRLGYGVQMSGAVFPGHNKFTDQFRFTDTLVVSPRAGNVLENMYTEHRGGRATAAEDAILIGQGWTNRAPGQRCLKNTGGTAPCPAR
jgi:hypothetical protein